MSVNYEISDIFNYTYDQAAHPMQVSTGTAVAEVTSISVAGLFANPVVQGQYFTLNSALDATAYYVWMDTAGDATTGDPAPAGLTEIAVNVSAVASDNDIAVAIASAIDLIGDFSAPAPGASVVTVTNAATGETTDAANVDIAVISITVTAQGYSASANANTGLMFRDAGNDDEVRLIGPGAVGQVLETTATNVIGWANPSSEVSTNTDFLAHLAANLTVTSTGLTNYTAVAFDTELFDTGNNYAAGEFTIPDTGIYYFHTQVVWGIANRSNKGQRRVEIVESLTTAVAQQDSEPGSNKNIPYNQNVTRLVSATAAEAYSVRVAHSAGASRDEDVQGGTPEAHGSYFEGIRIS
jgi:hypothetical protein